ncbi:MAG: glycosyltransferase [Candidatus Dormibacteraeota bacterium]|nr:glycosyltransferase [Candidatus Dormibacteraeota bacterium]
MAVVSMHTSPTAALGRSANGGLNVYVREVCSALDRLGVATDVFCRAPDPDAIPAPESLAAYSRVIYLPAGRAGLDKYELLDQVPAFVSAVREHIAGSGLAYDLIYSHYWLSGLVACALRGRLGLPWAHTAHTLAVVKNRQLAPGDRPEPEIRVDLEGEIARCADLLVVSTEAEGDHLRAAYHVRPDRIAVVSPACDLAALGPGTSRAEARRRLGAAGHPQFLFVGRLERLKGVDVALHALALLNRADAELTVIGDDSAVGGESERLRLQHLAEDLGLGARVRFLGSVPQPTLADHYAAADALIVPSYSESFGLVALEAQACGTPVVASCADGLASIVADGVTGFLVAGHAPADYAARMERLAADPELVRGMGRRARRRAAGFTWDRTANRLLEHFSTLPGTRASRASGRLQVGVQAASAD